MKFTEERSTGIELYLNVQVDKGRIRSDILFIDIYGLKFRELEDIFQLFQHFGESFNIIFLNALHHEVAQMLVY